MKRKPDGLRWNSAVSSRTVTAFIVLHVFKSKHPGYTFLRNLLDKTDILLYKAQMDILQKDAFTLKSDVVPCWRFTLKLPVTLCSKSSCKIRSNFEMERNSMRAHIFSVMVKPLKQHPGFYETIKVFTETQSS